jgi:hypothetical protein
MGKQKTTKPNAALKSVISSTTTDFDETRRSAGSISFEYRRLIVHTLECGHMVEKVGYRHITPSKRLKCQACASVEAKP